ncbi:MAG TPA: molybdopterin molybdenumtransferase MoeA [Polyangiaceae bacterium]|nr:molybdopterin molybdenumtransferase MoeA [Polyangiaceae bacterium]
MLVSFEDAIERALHGLGRLGEERVGLDRAHGRVLAADVLAPTSLPRFSHSAMDGYAVRASWFSGDGPWTFAVRGESRAGKAGPPLSHGNACRIFTGAPIPRGADAVVIQENVTRSGETITTTERALEGQNIRPEGADLERGALALAEGDRLTPGKVGLLAALDLAHATVARRPTVTFMSTGDELRAPGVLGASESIPESNSYVLGEMARRAGALARICPFTADDPDATERAIRRAMRGTDLLVTVGGASVGDHDLVRPAMETVGVAFHFWGVAIKPGKPTAVGHLGATKVLCLPGNPASAALTFALFGMPLIRAMQGDRTPRPLRVPTRVIGSHRRRPGREEYLRARLELHDGELCAVLPTGQSSGAVTSFAQADALVVLPVDRATIGNGERLEMIRLADL